MRAHLSLFLIFVFTISMAQANSFKIIEIDEKGHRVAVQTLGTVDQNITKYMATLPEGRQCVLEKINYDQQKGLLIFSSEDCHLEELLRIGHMVTPSFMDVPKAKQTYVNQPVVEQKLVQFKDSVRKENSDNKVYFSWRLSEYSFQRYKSDSTPTYSLEIDYHSFDLIPLSFVVDWQGKNIGLIAEFEEGGTGGTVMPYFKTFFGDFGLVAEFKKDYKGIEERVNSTVSSTESSEDCYLGGAFYRFRVDSAGIYFTARFAVGYGLIKTSSGSSSFDMEGILVNLDLEALFHAYDNFYIGPSLSFTNIWGELGNSTFELDGSWLELKVIPLAVMYKF